MRFPQSEDQELILDLLNRNLLRHRVRVVPAQNPTASGVRYFGERISILPQGGEGVEMLRFRDLDAVLAYLQRIDGDSPRGEDHAADVPAARF